MKGIIINFILSSLIKGILLFITILTGDIVEVIPIMLRFLFYFVIIGILDWQMLKRIKSEIIEFRLIKAIVFSYLSFVAVLWITGPLFQLYNYITKTVVEGEPEMPSSALIIFLTFGLITSITSSLTWTKMNNKKAANKS